MPRGGRTSQYGRRQDERERRGSENQHCFFAGRSVAKIDEAAIARVMIAATWVAGRHLSPVFAREIFGNVRLREASTRDGTGRMCRATAMLLLFVGPLPAATFASISRAATAPHASRAIIRSAAIRMDMERRSHERWPDTAATTGASNEPNEAKQLLQRIKDAGVAGAVSYAAWELAFWAASVPVCLVAYYQLTGHWPDFSDQDDMAKLGAEAFAFVNVARFAVPLRIGLALSTVPWVQANIIDRFASMRGDAAAPGSGREAAAPEAHWPGTPPPDAAVWHARWEADRHAEGEATRDIEVSVTQAEATRCDEEELEAKRAWLAKASGSRGR